MIPKEYSFIKLKPDQAALLRKNVLTLEMDLLHLIQRIINYKALRKLENQYRVNLRKALGETSQEIKTFYSNAPQIHLPKSEHIKQKPKQIKQKIKPEKLKHKELIKKSIKIKKEEKNKSFKDRIKEIREREQTVVKQKDKAKSHIEDKLSEIKRRLSQLGG